MLTSNKITEGFFVKLEILWTKVVDLHLWGCASFSSKRWTDFSRLYTGLYTRWNNCTFLTNRSIVAVVWCAWCQAKIGRFYMHRFTTIKLHSITQKRFHLFSILIKELQMTLGAAAAWRVKAFVDGSPVAVSANLITANSSVHTQVSSFASNSQIRTPLSWARPIMTW